MAERPHDPSFDWPSVFSAGDVVRVSDGQVGVVLLVGDCPGDDLPRYELHVDTTDGVGIYEPWSVEHDGTREARAEAKLHGLRGLR